MPQFPGSSSVRYLFGCNESLSKQSFTIILNQVNPPHCSEQLLAAQIPKTVLPGYSLQRAI